MPKVSIITPVYIDTSDKITWLDEMIQSVLSQTFTDWELILVDDRSPVAHGLRGTYNDSRLRWLSNATNSGPAMTRNTAVALAESDCILPLDSDDLLAANDVIERMYDVWQKDKTKTIYGNLQIYQPGPGGNFRRGNVVSLANYDFDNTLDLRGVMPVTVMHSIQAHQAAGGWKPAINLGREDLEYWIAAGKAGYCGQKINYTTLLYRKHDKSRDYRLRFELKETETMQQMIRDMHSDVYNGRYPVACCGKGGTAANINQPVASDPVVMSAQNMGVTKITELQGYDEKDLEWVAYQGPKQASFSVLVRGPRNLPSSYMVLGKGHFFQAHKQHHSFFEQRQHMGFRVNQPDPRGASAQTPAPKPEPVKITEVPKPQLSTLVSLDRIGSETRQPDVQRVESRKAEGEVIIEPNPAQSFSAMMETRPTIADLGLRDNISAILKENHWTIEGLAQAVTADLIKHKGIGLKSARSIIDKAQQLIKNR